MARVSITNDQATTLLGKSQFQSLKAAGSLVHDRVILTRKSHDKTVCVIGEVEHIVEALGWPVAGPALNQVGIRYQPPTSMEQAEREEQEGLERMKRNLRRPGRPGPTISEAEAAMLYENYRAGVEV